MGSVGAVRKVYGSLDCPNTLKVLACVFEHGLEFEFIPINLKDGEHKRQPFLSLHPFGEVPVMVDLDGLKRFESRAIIRSMSFEFYMNVQEPLVYRDGRKQAVVANWIDVEDNYFEPPALVLIKNDVQPHEENDVILADAEAKLAKVLDIYEARLAKLKYLAADKFTIADLLHLPNLQSLLGTAKGKKLIDSRPKVSAWCSTILARLAWCKVLEMKMKAQSN